VKKFFLFFLLVSCLKLDNSNPSVPNYNVIANLVSGNDTQYVFFDKTYKPYEEHHYGLEGAKIFVYNNNVNYQFNYPKLIDTINYYYNVFNPNPNDSFYLKIITPTSETLFSKTYIPGDFQIIQPANDETITIPSNKLVIWTKSSNAYIYKINVYKKSRDSTRKFEIPYLSNDTFSDILKYPYFFPDSGLWTIAIMAINEPLYQYLSIGKCNIDNAVGVFGGVVLRKVRIYVK